jgi:hypothetical protein
VAYVLEMKILNLPRGLVRVQLAAPVSAQQPLYLPHIHTAPKTPFHYHAELVFAHSNI